MPSYVGKLASRKNKTSSTGVSTFYEIVAHENHHFVLWVGWWGIGENLWTITMKKMNAGK